MRVRRWMLAVLAGVGLVFNAVFFCRKRKNRTACYLATQEGVQSEEAGAEKEDLLEACESSGDGLLSSFTQTTAKREERQSLLAGRDLSFDQGNSLLKRDRTESPESKAKSQVAEEVVTTGDQPLPDGSKGFQSIFGDVASSVSPSSIQPSKKAKLLADDILVEEQPILVDHAHGTEEGQGHATAVSSVGGQILAAELPPNPVDVDYLQELIEHELGPPKFAKAKTEDVPHHRPGDSHGPGSLRQLLDEEFGPPKFAVPKVVDTVAESEDQPEPVEKPHLRMEVLSGPATGHILDTTDITQELKVGRYPDCSLALTDDQEVSGSHAVITFDHKEKRWKLTDVGSLNGTLLNDRVISQNYRQQGEPHSLCEGDVVYFGNSTRVLVACNPSPIPARDRSNPGSSAAINASPPNSEPALETGMVIHSTGPLSGNANPSPAPTSSRNTPRFRSQSLQILNPLGPHLAVETYPSIAATLAVHQRLGADHKRTNTGCEDVVYWELPFAPFNKAGCLGIFDGHHGVQAAAKARELVPPTLRAKLAEGTGGGGLLLGRDADAQRALLRSVFLETDAALAIDEGCTATLVIVERNPEDNSLLLQSANVGDSSALLIMLPTPDSPAKAGSPPAGLPQVSWSTIPSSGPGIPAGMAAAGSGAGKWVKLTEDHRIANSVAERKRLQQHGHTVKNRLYGLNISRMLGDRFLKDEGLGFIAEPHVSGVAALPPGSRSFLVIASDGLWDVVTEARAAALVAKAAAEELGVSAGDVADILLSQAITLRSKDDISVIAVEFRP